MRNPGVFAVNPKPSLRGAKAPKQSSLLVSDSGLLRGAHAPELAPSRGLPPPSFQEHSPLNADRDANLLFRYEGWRVANHNARFCGTHRRIVSVRLTC